MCLAWMEASVVAIADATTLIIKCWREESMTWELALIYLKRETAAGSLSVSMSQEES